jgi:hypothetical protein
VIDVLKKQRPINWLRLNRLYIITNKNNKLNNLFLFLKLFKKIKSIKIKSFFFFLKKNKNFLFKNQIILPNASSQIKPKCFFGGYSRGVRWSISRLNILKKSFTGNLNNISIARW